MGIGVQMLHKAKHFQVVVLTGDFSFTRFKWSVIEFNQGWGSTSVFFLIICVQRLYGWLDQVLSNYRANMS